MAIRLYYEQCDIKPFEVKQAENGVLWTDPVSLLEEIGKEGREALMEILIINYREDFAEELASILHFEHKNFGGPK